MVLHAATFHEVLEAAEALTLDERESLLDVLERRVAMERREALVRAVQESRREYEAGRGVVDSVDGIMDDVLS